MEWHGRLDTTSGRNADVEFSKILRTTQRERSKDIGMPLFRQRNSTAERLLQTELSPLNMCPPKGFNRYKKTKLRKYTKERCVWYMPEAVEGIGHVMELGNDTVFDKNLPIVKDPKSVMDHLHAKTYFKSYQ